MLNNLYENIGGKIKGLAKWIFVVEAIGAIITGLILFFIDDSFILLGLLAMICGPVIAWVSSWILYAFGELVEATCNNQNNTKQILKKLNEKDLEKTQTTANSTPSVVRKTSSEPNVQAHKWLCDGCKKMRTQTPCEYCGGK